MNLQTKQKLDNVKIEEEYSYLDGKHLGMKEALKAFPKTETLALQWAIIHEITDRKCFLKGYREGLKHRNPKLSIVKF
jgi:hypothetical protein